MSRAKNMCERCKKRPHCTTLCKRAAKYADKDEVPQREITLTSLMPENTDVFEFITNAFYTNYEINGQPSIADCAEYFKCPDELKFPLAKVTKEILRLRYFEGLTFKEIARRVHLKEAACEKRHKRAIEKLKKLYANGRKAMPDKD